MYPFIRYYYLMHYHPLVITGLTVSVAGLGCGGNSRLGRGRGANFDECVAVARAAIDLRVDFLDTTEVYGTDDIVGAAVKECDHARLVISTKALFKADDTAETVTQRVEVTLRRLAALQPTTIALMHGPTFKGDGAAALEGLADHYATQ